MYHVPLSLRIAILWSGGTFDSDLATKCHGMLIPGRSKSVDVEEARILQTDQEQDKCAICFNTEEGKLVEWWGCGHRIHEECILDKFTTKPRLMKCPYCRNTKPGRAWTASMWSPPPGQEPLPMHHPCYTTPANWVPPSIRSTDRPRPVGQPYQPIQPGRHPVISPAVQPGRPM
ncbi:hypothetical protein PSHT_00743 [Puccinia striiformis]|uniref:RING-type domain-containing protein n=3 Tax=Puccinia striiformis TaxID=27350 RepID=A0A0L0VGD3_9BASI|nr:hypothetical protein PSTG_08431 [Puccinia striiformis f. sp. tritici PST-78]POV98905.1 hypothetical protein PSTT_14115 [Puccinia striiformis]POW22901.1 hypothetical protein PSHT_00743 [Puccinia striiformis]